MPEAPKTTGASVIDGPTLEASFRARDKESLSLVGVGWNVLQQDRVLDELEQGVTRPAKHRRPV